MGNEISRYLHGRREKERGGGGGEDTKRTSHEVLVLLPPSPIFPFFSLPYLRLPCRRYFSTKIGLMHGYYENNITYSHVAQNVSSRPAFYNFPGL